MSAPANRSRVPRSLAILIGLTTTAIFLQALTAGLFVDQPGRDSWVTVHGLMADATWVCALLTALVAFRRVRRVQPRLWTGSAMLFVLALAQTGIGHLITDGGMDSLIAVHVPLAIAIFGLAIWLAVAARPGREHVVEPYGDSGRSAPKVSQSLT